MRFRFLSYIVGILLLSGVLGANLIKVTSLSHHKKQWFRSYYDGKEVWFTGADHIACYGWPFTVLKTVVASDHFECVHQQTAHKAVPLPPESFTAWYWPAFIVNVLVGFVIIIAGFLICEFSLRRYSCY